MNDKNVSAKVDGTMGTVKFMLWLVVLSLLLFFFDSYSGTTTQSVIYPFVALYIVFISLMMAVPMVKLYKNASLPHLEELTGDKKAAGKVEKYIQALLFFLIMFFILSLLMYSAEKVNLDYAFLIGMLCLTLGVLLVLLVNLIFDAVKNLDFRKHVFLAVLGVPLAMITYYGASLIHHRPVWALGLSIVIALSLLLIQLRYASSTNFNVDGFSPFGKHFAVLSYVSMFYCLLFVFPHFVDVMDLVRYRDCPRYRAVVLAYFHDRTDDNKQLRDLERLKLDMFGKERYNLLAEKESQAEELVREDDRRMILYVGKMTVKGQEDFYVFGHNAQGVLYEKLSSYVENHVRGNLRRYLVPADDELEVAKREAERRLESAFHHYIKHRENMDVDTKDTYVKMLDWYVYLKVNKSKFSESIYEREYNTMLVDYVRKHMKTDLVFKDMESAQKWVLKQELLIVTDEVCVREALMIYGVSEDYLYFVP